MIYQIRLEIHNTTKSSNCPSGDISITATSALNVGELKTAIEAKIKVPYGCCLVGEEIISNNRVKENSDQLGPFEKKVIYSAQMQNAITSPQEITSPQVQTQSRLMGMFDPRVQAIKTKIAEKFVKSSAPPLDFSSQGKPAKSHPKSKIPLGTIIKGKH